MRCLVFLAIAGISCAPASPRASVVVEQDADFAATLGGLRATLARSGIELDDAADIESCSNAHARCVRCQVARSGSAALVDATALAFAMYPPALLAATEVKHVTLCRSIDVADRTIAPAGMALLDQQRILVNIGAYATRDDLVIDHAIHHELFHHLDYALTRYADDAEWAALNPPAFSYADPDMQYRDRDLGSVRPTGFITTYATQNVLEDRASTFELLVADHAAACAISATDPLVARKIALLTTRVRRLADPSPLLAPCPPPAKPEKRRVDLRLHGMR